MKRNHKSKPSKTQKMEQQINKFAIFAKMNLDDAKLQFLLREKRNNTENLQQLHLQKNNLTIGSISILAQMKWDNLNELNLGNNLIGDKGCKVLSTIYIPQLQILELSSNRLSDLAVAYLCKMRFPRLSFLYLTDNNILNGIQLLVKADLANLYQLCVDDNKIMRVSSLIKVLQSEWQIFGKFIAGKEIKPPDIQSFTNQEKNLLHDLFMAKFKFKTSRHYFSI